jgi:hypothetical protein
VQSDQTKNKLLGVSRTGVRLYGHRPRPRAETELMHPTGLIHEYSLAA